jgi:hypothetical protein
MGITRHGVAAFISPSRRSGGVRGYQSTRGSPRSSRLFWRYSIRAERQKG